jgi:hypothetical protein
MARLSHTSPAPPGEAATFPTRLPPAGLGPSRAAAIRQQQVTFFKLLLSSAATGFPDLKARWPVRNSPVTIRRREKKSRISVVCFFFLKKMAVG